MTGTPRPAPSGVHVFEPADTTRPRRSFAELASRAGLTGIPRAAVAGLVALTVGAVAFTALKLTGEDAGGEFAFTAGAGPSSALGTQTGATPGGGPEAPAVWIHVAGAVNAPGLFELPEGARVGDAVKAAGGLRADAIADSVNLARPLRDGEQVYVPSESESQGQGNAAVPLPGSGGQPGADASTQPAIDINRATAAELDALPGVGPATAERIVADREANGPFIFPEDLMRVPASVRRSSRRWRRWWWSGDPPRSAEYPPALLGRVERLRRRPSGGRGLMAPGRGSRRAASGTGSGRMRVCREYRWGVGVAVNTLSQRNPYHYVRTARTSPRLRHRDGGVGGVAPSASSDGHGACRRPGHGGARPAARYVRLECDSSLTRQAEWIDPGDDGARRRPTRCGSAHAGERKSCPDRGRQRVGTESASEGRGRLSACCQRGRGAVVSGD